MRDTAVHELKPATRLVCNLPPAAAVTQGSPTMNHTNDQALPLRGTQVCCPAELWQEHRATPVESVCSRATGSHTADPFALLNNPQRLDKVFSARQLPCRNSERRMGPSPAFGTPLAAPPLAAAPPDSLLLLSLSLLLPSFRRRFLRFLSLSFSPRFRLSLLLFLRFFLSALSALRFLTFPSSTCAWLDL